MAYAATIILGWLLTQPRENREHRWLQNFITLAAVHTCDLYVTVNSRAGTNVISTITQINCTGLPTTTTAFSVSSANVWTWVGTLTLGYGISTPTIHFDETANDYRFVADAVKFVYVR
jgi:hypothetical protein